jgi:large subunit ribosomal protein L22
MPGLKTNERDGTRAVLRYSRMSPYKVREVLDLIRGKPVAEAEDILRLTERDAAIPVGKLLHSAVANAEANDSLDGEELFVSACFADEGPTIKRWRPRARGRATRIRKRTSHVTIIVSRLPEERLARLQAQRQAEQAARRARRVAGARKSRTTAPNAEGQSGRNRAGRRRRGAAAEEAEELTAAETTATETEEGTVDQDEAAPAAADTALTDHDKAEADQATTDAERSASPAEAATENVTEQGADESQATDETPAEEGRSGKGKRKGKGTE